MPEVTNPDASKPPVAKLVYLDTGAHPDAIVLATDDSDPRWDPRMALPVDKLKVQDIAEHGIEVPLDVTEGPNGTYFVNDGRQRAKAIPDANKLRAKAKLPALVVPLLVTGRDDLAAMTAGYRLNAMRQGNDPITEAETISRYLDVGHSMAEAAKDGRHTVKRVEEYLSLLALPPEVKALVRSGELALTSAVELAKKDDAALAKAAARIVAQAAQGKVTGKDVKAAATGKGTVDGLPRKGVKALSESLATATFAGPHGAAVKAAAIAICETVLDARKLDELMAVLDGLSKSKKE